MDGTGSLNDHSVDNVGNGGTTLEQVVATGAYSISETEGAGTLLSDYVSTVACVDTANGNVPVSINNNTGVSGNIIVNSGQDIVCTFTNVKPQWGSRLRR